MTPAVEMALAEKFLRLHENGELSDPKDIIRALSLRWFRLNALYKIKDKNGKVVRFKPNEAQRELYRSGHLRDIILKARQLGFTTFVMIFCLDSCLFTDNYSAGCIAHNEKAAKSIFRSKVKFAYTHIGNAWLQIFKNIGLKFPKPVNDRDNGYVFDNGSSIHVSTGYRGDTLQHLHVSEFGKICRMYPDRAQEIVTGAFEAVGIDGRLTIESTAEGREGYFYSYCDNAQKLLLAGKKPTVLDFQFHFFPWWRDPSYSLEGDDVVIPQHLADYFEELKVNHGIALTQLQKNWYAKKAETLMDDMKREYPSRPEEAFEQSAEGAYFIKQMMFLRKNKRITKKVHYNPQYPVITAWDLGMNDAMSIWFVQIIGREIHVIDYLEDSGEGIQYYAAELNKKGYSYSYHFGPHDLSVRELGADGKTRQEDFAKYGIKFEIVPRVSNQMEGVNAVRQFLPQCWFDEEKASRGIDCLDNYRKEWDVRLGTYKNMPRHDWASHGAKAFETLARSELFELSSAAGAPIPQKRASSGRGWGGHT
ncbi:MULTISPECIES: terminase [unclassified Neptuniibacter]|uniref:terminase n=1 Tax=unclassified Neptuniibacter TaxID=2630693 RepID=UPI0025F6873D|nr:MULTISPECIES: terminase [unclassified Neptuniibacter]